MNDTTVNARLHPFWLWTLYMQLVWKHSQDLVWTRAVCGLHFHHTGRMQKTPFSYITYTASVLKINEDPGTAINKDEQKWIIRARSFCAPEEKSHFQPSKQNILHGYFTSAAPPKVSASPAAIDPSQVVQGLEHTCTETCQTRNPFST